MPAPSTNNDDILSNLQLAMLMQQGLNNLCRNKHVTKPLDVKRRSPHVVLTAHLMLNPCMMVA